MQTTRDSLTAMENGIVTENLPPTFQDAVYIARRLGIRYLRIDSLCIIQDSPEDWNHESGRMAYVYSNCALTISAEAARDSSYGIFRSAHVHRSKHTLKLSCHLNNYGLDFVWVASKSRLEYEPFHLEQRAWVLQEMLLPPRVLTYTSQQLVYTCRSTQLCENAHYSRELGSQYQLERPQDTKKILFPALPAR